MRYVWGLLLGCIGGLSADQNLLALQYRGVTLQMDGNRSYHIERIEPFACMEVGITPENLFLHPERLPKACRHTVIRTLGAIQPMQIDPKIKTVGELEVLDFLEKMQKEPGGYILVDARKAQWYRMLTIPGAVNIPYTEIRYDADFPEEHVRLLQLLRIVKSKKEYDFSRAKKALFFCNGAWCVQSVKAIRYLTEMGYPKERLLWYRGGMQDWISMGFRGVKPSENR